MAEFHNKTCRMLPRHIKTKRYQGVTRITRPIGARSSVSKYR